MHAQLVDLVKERCSADVEFEQAWLDFVKAHGQNWKVPKRHDEGFLHEFVLGYGFRNENTSMPSTSSATAQPSAWQN